MILHKFAFSETATYLHSLIEDQHKVVADKTAKNISGPQSEATNETTADKPFKAVETQKPEAPTEKFKCNQCEYENPSEKGLAQHMRMKHCPWLELRCSKKEHIDLCCDVIHNMGRGPKVKAPPRVFHPNLKMYGEYNMERSDSKSSVYTFNLALPGRPDGQKHMECFYVI